MFPISVTLNGLRHGWGSHADNASVPGMHGTCQRPWNCGAGASGGWGGGFEHPRGTGKGGISVLRSTAPWDRGRPAGFTGKGFSMQYFQTAVCRGGRKPRDGNPRTRGLPTLPGRDVAELSDRDVKGSDTPNVLGSKRNTRVPTAGYKCTEMHAPVSVFTWRLREAPIRSLTA